MGSMRIYASRMPQPRQLLAVPTASFAFARCLLVCLLIFANFAASELRHTSQPNVGHLRALQGASASPSPSITPTLSTSETAASSETPSTSETATDTRTPSRSATRTASRTPTLSATTSRTPTVSVTSTTTSSASSTSTTSGTTSTTVTTTPTRSATVTASPSSSPCPQAQYYDTQLRTCSCYQSFTTAVGALCVCLPGMRLIGDACRFDTVANALPASPVVMAEGDVAVWNVTLAQSLTGLSLVVLSCTATLLPDSTTFVSVLRYQANTPLTRTLSLPIPNDGIPFRPRAVVISIDISQQTDAAYLYPLALPSLNFVVLDRSQCGAGQHISNTGCVCDDPAAVLIGETCQCSSGFVLQSVTGACAISLPLLYSPIVTVSEGTTVTTTLALSALVPSSCVVGVDFQISASIDQFQGCAHAVAVSSTSFLFQPGQSFTAVNISSTSAYAGVVVGNVSCAISVVLNRDTSCKVLWPRDQNAIGSVVINVIEADAAAMLVPTQVNIRSLAGVAFPVSLAARPSCTVRVILFIPSDLRVSWSSSLLFTPLNYSAPVQGLVTLANPDAYTAGSSSLYITFATACEDSNSISPFHTQATMVVGINLAVSSLLWSLPPLVSLNKGMQLQFNTTLSQPTQAMLTCTANYSWLQVSPEQALLMPYSPFAMTLQHTNDGVLHNNVTALIQCSTLLAPPLVSIVRLVDSSSRSFTSTFNSTALLREGTGPYVFNITIGTALRGPVELSLIVVAPGVSGWFTGGMSLYRIPVLGAVWPLNIPIFVAVTDDRSYTGNRSASVTVRVSSAPSDPEYAGLQVARSFPVVENDIVSLQLSFPSPVTESLPFSVLITPSVMLTAGQLVNVSLACAWPGARITPRSALLSASNSFFAPSVTLPADGFSGSATVTCTTTSAAFVPDVTVPVFANLSTSNTTTVTSVDPVALQLVVDGNIVTSLQFNAELGSSITGYIRTASTLQSTATVTVQLLPAVGVSLSTTAVNLTRSNCRTNSISNQVTFTLQSVSSTGLLPQRLNVFVAAFTLNSGFVSSAITVSLYVVPAAALSAPASVTVVEGASTNITISRAGQSLASGLLLNLTILPLPLFTSMDVIMLSATQLVLYNTATIQVFARANNIALRNYLSFSSICVIRVNCLNESTIPPFNITVIVQEMDPVALDIVMLSPSAGIIAGAGVDVRVSVSAPIAASVAVYMTIQSQNVTLPAASIPQSAVYRAFVPADFVCRGTRLAQLIFRTKSSITAYDSLTRIMQVAAGDTVLPSWSWNVTVVELLTGGSAVRVALTPACSPSAPVTIAAAFAAGYPFIIAPASATLPALSSSALVFTLTSPSDSLYSPASVMTFQVKFDVLPPQSLWSAPPTLPVVLNSTITTQLLVNTTSVVVSEATSAIGAALSITLSSRPYIGDVQSGLIAPSTVTVFPFIYTGTCSSDDGLGMTLPRAECTIDADCPELGQVCTASTLAYLAPSILQFNHSNWNIPQLVRVFAFDDASVDGTVLTALKFRLASSAHGYRESPPLSPLPTVAVTILDNDTAGLALASVDGLNSFFLRESSSTQLRVRLLAQPQRLVNVSCAVSDSSRMRLLPASFSFNTSNWSVGSMLSISGIDDGIAQVDITASVSVTCRMSSLYGMEPLGPATTIVGQLIDTNIARVVLEATPRSNGSYRCVYTRNDAQLTDDDCTGLCSSISPCPVDYCACSTVSTSGLVVGSFGLYDAFVVRLTSSPTRSVNVSFNSTVITARNSTIDACTRAALFQNVTWPSLTFVPASITFPANIGTDFVILVRVIASQAFVSTPSMVVSISAVVSSNDPLYNGTVGAAACRAGAVYTSSNSSGQCPTSSSISLNATLLANDMRSIQLVSATLSNDMRALTLSFNGSVVMPALDTCTAALAFENTTALQICAADMNATASALVVGSASSCICISSASGACTSVSVQLGARSQLFPGLYVRLLSGWTSVSPAGGRVTGRARIAFPVTAPVMMIQLHGPTLIGSCDGVELVAVVRGSAGPPSSFTWQVASVSDASSQMDLLNTLPRSPTLTSLLSFVSSQNASAIRISADLIPVGAVVLLQVIARNAITVATANASVTKSISDSPSLWFDGVSIGQSTVTLSSFDAVTLTVSPSACSLNSAQISVYWLGAQGMFPSDRLNTTSSSTFPIDSSIWNADAHPLVNGAFRNGRMLPLTGFPVGSYRLRACAISCFIGCQYACANLTVVISEPPFVLTVNRVQSGGRVVVQAGTQLLQPSLVDQFGALVPSLAIDATDVWSCDPSCAIIPTTNNSVASLIPSSSQTSYSVSLRRTYSAVPLSYTFTGSVQLVTAPYASVSINSTQIGGTVSPSTLLDVNDRVSLVATVSADVIASYWRCIGCSAPFTVSLRFTSGQPCASSDSVYALISPETLIIGSGAASPGSLLRYQFVAVGPASTTVINVTVAYKPALACALTYTIDVDSAMLLLFVADCALPSDVSIRFGVIDGDGGMFALSNWQMSPMLHVRLLPPGNWTIMAQLSSQAASGSCSSVLQIPFDMPSPWDSSAGLSMLLHALDDGSLSSIRTVVFGWNAALMLSQANPARPSFYLATPQQRAQRASLIAQFPAVHASISMSPQSSLLDALSVLYTMASVSSQLSSSTAATLATSLDGVLNSTLLLEAVWSADDVRQCTRVVSALSTYMFAFGSSASVITRFQLRTALPLLSKCISTFSSHLESDEIPTVIELPAFSVAMSRLNTARMQTCASLNSSVSVSVNNAFLSSTPPAAVLIIRHNQDPFINASSTWALGTRVSDVFSVRLVARDGVSVIPASPQFNVSIDVPVDPASMALLVSMNESQALICIASIGLDGFVSRAGCITDASRTFGTGLVRCICNRTGEIGIVLTQIPRLLFTQSFPQIVSRGSSSQYSFSLSTAPVGAVSVFISAPTSFCANQYATVLDYGHACADELDCDIGQFCIDDAAVTVSPSRIVLTSANWSVPVPVRIAATTSSIRGGKTILIRHDTMSRDDYLYDRLTHAISVSVADDLYVNMVVPVVAPDALAVGGSPALVCVQLVSEPLWPFVIDFMSEASIISFSNDAAFVVSSNNYLEPICTNASVAATSKALPPVMSVEVSVSLCALGVPAVSSYMELLLNVEVVSVIIPSILLNRDIVLMEPSVGWAEYAVSLNAQPDAAYALLVQVDALHTGSIAVVPSMVTFSQLNWSVPQRIRITSLRSSWPPDTVISVSHSVNSSAFLLTAALTVNMSLYDDATMLLSEMASKPCMLTEGSSISYKLSLSVAPTHLVTVYTSVTCIFPNNCADAFTMPVSTIQFSALNWMQPALIAFSALEDTVVWPATTRAYIQHAATSQDVRFDGLVLNSTELGLIDNDVPGISLTAPSQALLIEGGSSVSLYVSLLSQPSIGCVVVLDWLVPVDSSNRIRFEPSSPSFNSTNWSTPMLVSMFAVNDAVDSDVVSFVNISVAVDNNVTSDAGYAASLSLVQQFSASVQDNASAPSLRTSTSVVLLNESSPSAPSAGTFSVFLLSRPYVALTLRIACTTCIGSIRMIPDTMTILPSDWSTPRACSVYADNDFTFRGPFYTNTLSISVVGADIVTRYSTWAALTVAVNVLDMNQPAVICDDASSAVLSWFTGPSWLLFSVQLNTIPLGDVRIVTVASPAVLNSTPLSLTFTATSWPSRVVFNISLLSIVALNNSLNSVALVVQADSLTDPYYNGLTASTSLMVTSGTHSRPVITLPASVVVDRLSTVLNMSAAQSFDPDRNYPLAYQWTTNTSSLVLDNALRSMVFISNFSIGTHVVTVTVTNSVGFSSIAFVTLWVPGFMSSPATTTPVCYFQRLCSLRWEVAGLDARLPFKATVVLSDGRVEAAVFSGQLSLATGSTSVTASWVTPVAWNAASTNVYVVLQARYGDGVQTQLVSSTAQLVLQQPYQWQFISYGVCNVTCGNGYRPRVVRCQDVSSSQPALAPTFRCAAVQQQPDGIAACFAGPCDSEPFAYAVSSFGSCSAMCGRGFRTREVTCVDVHANPVQPVYCAGLDVPAPTMPCDAGPCDSFTLLRSPASDCNAACGAGLQTVSSTCVSQRTGAAVSLLSCNATPENSTVSVACANSECMTSYRWVVSSQWSACSVACGGGVAYRNLTCVRVSDGAVSLTPAFHCPASMIKPAFVKACNTFVCSRYALDVTPWSGCSTECGGTRRRSVSCVSVNSTTVIAAAPLERCGQLVPASVEACPACTFCDTTACSGHGSCNTSTAVCDCDFNYEGRYCEQLRRCAGPTDSGGRCCTVGAILDINFDCCVGRLDVNGACCVSGIVNACGVCDGSVTAVQSADGFCCTNGVLDAAGVCCASGLLDMFGVCDGGNTSPLTYAQIQATVASTISLAALTAVLSTALQRPVSSLLIQPPLRLDGFNASSNILTPGTWSLVMQALPFGGSNVYSSSVLQALLATAQVQLISVWSVPVCGNAVCEIDERPIPSRSVIGCTIDCPFPVLSCPVYDGKECSGTGTCVRSPLGTAACACWSSMGYMGDACERCAPGFVALPDEPLACVRVEVPVAFQSLSPSPTASIRIAPSPLGPILRSSNATQMPIVLVAVFGGLGGLAVVCVCLWVHRAAKRKAAMVMDSELELMSTNRRARRPISANATRRRQYETSPLKKRDYAEDSNELTLVLEPEPEGIHAFGVFMKDPAQPSAVMHRTVPVIRRDEMYAQDEVDGSTQRSDNSRNDTDAESPTYSGDDGISQVQAAHHGLIDEGVQQPSVIEGTLTTNGEQHSCSTGRESSASASGFGSVNSRTLAQASAVTTVHLLDEHTGTVETLDGLVATPVAARSRGVTPIQFDSDHSADAVPVPAETDAPFGLESGRWAAEDHHDGDDSISNSVHVTPYAANTAAETAAGITHSMYDSAELMPVSITQLQDAGEDKEDVQERTVPPPLAWYYALPKVITKSAAQDTVRRHRGKRQQKPARSDPAAASASSRGAAPVPSEPSQPIQYPLADPFVLDSRASEDGVEAAPTEQELAIQRAHRHEYVRVQRPQRRLPTLTHVRKVSSNRFAYLDQDN